MAGLVRRLPFALPGRPAGATSTFGLSGVDYDYALGGEPYLSGVNDERPMTRRGAPLKKEQFDNQEIPGEQSLKNWWLRSQSTFVGGAGLLYQDPSVDNAYAIRFGESVGINPWSNGQISLLRSTTERISSTATEQHVLGWSDGTDRYWHAADAVLTSDDGTTTTAVTWGGTGDIVSLASDGTDYFAADATGIYTGTGSGAGSLLWNTGSADTVIGWVKGRLMAGIGASVYELADTTGAPALPSPNYTHLNASWKWTAFSEGPSAIYAAGYAGSVSSIFKFVLDTNGAVPVLTGGIVTAQLPHGEQIHSLRVYLGSFVGIGTNRGFRVGQIDGNGDIAYGPLLIATDEPVKAVGAYDRFFFVGATDAIDGKSGLWRVDLGQPLQGSGPARALRYAYATDLQAHETGAVTGVTNFGNSDRMVFAVAGQGAYLESASDLEETGYLTTGRVRYNTLEPKIFKFVSVRQPLTQTGSTSVSVIDPGGGETSVISVSDGSSTAIDNVLLPGLTSSVEWIQLKLTLGRDPTDSTVGSVVNGWQLKAMPGAVRQRVMTIPFLMFDFEKDKYGQRYGWDGRARERLDAFEALFQRGDAVSFQDLGSGQSTLVVIDDYSYEQRTPPARQSGMGGVLWVELRTIADVVA